jgi:hypothetical protein
MAQAFLGMGAGGMANAGLAAARGAGGAGPAVGPGAFLAGGEEQGGNAAATQPGLQGLSPEKALEALAGDAELAVVVEELKAGGPAALEKYWNDVDVMSKISARLRAASLGGDKKKEQGAEAEAEAVDADGLPVAMKKPSSVDASAAADAPPPPPATPGAGPASALHAAARRGDAAAIKALLSESDNAEDADASAAARALLLDAPGDRSGATALGVAVGMGRLEAARALLDAGASVDKPDARGNTPLHYAAGYGRKDCLDLLLERGADLKAQNAGGQKAVDVARQNGEAVIVTSLAAREKREKKAGSAGPSLGTKKAAVAAPKKK